MKEKTHLSLRALPKWAKIVIPIVILLVLVGIVGSFYLDRIIYSQLRNTVKTKSKGLYQLDYSKVSVNLLSRTLVIRNAKLNVDSLAYKRISAPDHPLPLTIEGSFPSIRISGIRWMKLLLSGKLMASGVELPSPDITLTIFKKKSPDSTDKSDSINNALDGIDLKSASIQNASLHYREYNADTGAAAQYDFKSLSIHLQQRAGTSASASRKTSWEAKNISLSNFEFRTSDSLYLMRLNDFTYSANKQVISIGKFYIQPRSTEKEYAKLAHQKERNDLAFENVTLSNVNLDSLMNGEINVETASIGSGHWNLYLNRTPPLPPAREHVVPSQTLQRISGKVNISKLLINKFQLNYREFNTATGKTGEIRFNDISGSALNITNNPARIAENPQLNVSLTARLMGTGDFKARFQFMLNDSAGKFSVAATLSTIDATHFNPAFIPLNKMEIKKGTIKELKCSGSGNENGITGNVSMLYHDLHIAVMEKDDNADTLKRKTFTSMVANIFVKNDNPQKDEPVRTAENISIKRDPRKSFFNLLWMALFTGIVKIATGKSAPV